MVSAVDALAAKISLLHHLHNLPELPSINGPSPRISAGVQPERTLTLKHEISITQQLAFICGYSSSPYHVTAICIEETLAQPSLVLRLAANTGQHDGLIKGLTEVGQILQNEAGGVHHQENKRKLSQVVIALNRNRILSRIRSRHATCQKSRGKASVLKRLRTAAQLLQGSSSDSVRVKCLAEEVNALQEKFEAVEGGYDQDTNPDQQVDNLLALVGGIHSLLVRFETDLRCIPYTPGEWSGNATDALMDRLRKISQYTTACEELLRAARRYEVFTSITVHFVDLQQSGKSINPECSADDVLAASSICRTLSRVSNHRHETQAATERLIKERLKGTTRLHAEIQLLLFYEQYETALPPRVICASKRACYLCNLFFKLHGFYHMPDTHGKLYETWRWPDFSVLPIDKAQAFLDSMLPRFARAIELKTEELLGSGNLPARVEPFESTVDLLKAMTPSVRSHAMTIFSSSLSSILSPRSQDGTVVHALTAARKPSIGRGRSHIASGSVGTTGSSSPGRDGTTLAPNTEVQSVFIRRGQTIIHLFSGKDKSLLVYAPHLIVHLDFVASPISKVTSNMPYARDHCIQLEIRCLTWPEHQDQLHNCSSVDLETGDWVEIQGLEHSMFSACGLLLKQKTTLLRLRGVRGSVDPESACTSLR